MVAVWSSHHRTYDCVMSTRWGSYVFSRRMGVLPFLGMSHNPLSARSISESVVSYMVAREISAIEVVAHKRAFVERRSVSYGWPFCVSQKVRCAGDTKNPPILCKSCLNDPVVRSHRAKFVPARTKYVLGLFGSRAIKRGRSFIRSESSVCLYNDSMRTLLLVRRSSSQSPGVCISA
ncbi:MAG: hypothetical protein G01um101429_958 [Parcubacteria group bacterium Gr01-1014_29]|nr:MAG: hypothetical protein G01um101429_958 [Parcubacteria group bacterium Gr01-1014_29]